MASLELLRQHCPNCNAPYCEQINDAPKSHEALDNEFIKFGKTAAKVLSHRSKAVDIDRDIELDTNIKFILLDKNQRLGLKSFSIPERNVFAIQCMTQEVNNGGFEQFFYNDSGQLAFDLVPALEAIGSVEALTIAQQAVERFGKPRSLSSSARAKQISKVTNDGEESVWNDLDSSYYGLDENVESLTIDYIKKHLGSFDS